MSYAGTRDALGSLEDAPDTITTDQNNYSPDGWPDVSVALLSSDDPHEITGLAALPANARHVAKYIVNIGNENIVLVFNSAASQAGNRLFPPGGGNLTLGPTQAALCIYDYVTHFLGNPVAGGWRIFSL